MAPTGPLAWELPYAMGMALEEKKNQSNNSEGDPRSQKKTGAKMDKLQEIFNKKLDLKNKQT